MISSPLELTVVPKEGRKKVAGGYLEITLDPGEKKKVQRQRP